MKARTIQEQTGWKRPFPSAICQDFDVRRSVTEYDFDLHDAGFRRYCEARGVLHLAGVRRRFAFTADHLATKARFLELFGVVIQNKQPGKPAYVFSAREMDTHWRIMLAAKGAFQDAWELFKGEK